MACCVIKTYTVSENARRLLGFFEHVGCYCSGCFLSVYLQVIIIVKRVRIVKSNKLQLFYDLRGP